MNSNLHTKASPWQPSATQMNVTAAPFRPPPFSLSQDPLLAAGLANNNNNNGNLNVSNVMGGGGFGRSGSGMGGSLTGGPVAGPAGYSSASIGTPVHHNMGMAGNNSSSPNGGGPVKYKTELCRNWEATGHCAYRGCTYAHGYEDLRAGTIMGGGGGAGGGMNGMVGPAPGGMGGHPMPMPMGLHPQMGPPPQHGGPSGSSTTSPQQHTYSLTNNVVNAANAPHGNNSAANSLMNTSAGGGGGGGGNSSTTGGAINNGGVAAVGASALPPMMGGGGNVSGRSSAMGTPVAGTYRIMGGVVGLGAGLGGGNSPIPPPSAPAPIQATMPRPISADRRIPMCPSEQLLELIMIELRSERDNLLNQQDVNRQLEQQLKREQLMRQRNVNNTAVVEGVCALVEEAIRKRTAAINDIKRALGEDAMEGLVDAMIDGDGY